MPPRPGCIFMPIRARSSPDETGKIVARGARNGSHSILQMGGPRREETSLATRRDGTRAGGVPGRATPSPPEGRSREMHTVYVSTEPCGGLLRGCDVYWFGRVEGRIRAVPCLQLEENLSGPWWMSTSTYAICTDRMPERGVRDNMEVVDPPLHKGGLLIAHADSEEHGQNVDDIYPSEGQQQHQVRRENDSDARPGRHTPGGITPGEWTRICPHRRTMAPSPSSTSAVPKPMVAE